MEQKKKKYYVSGKIGDWPVEKYMKCFNDAKEKVVALGYTPILPTDLEHNHDKKWLSFMKEDITEMMKCDGVFAMLNWTDSKGAKIEINLAKDLGMEVIYESIEKS